MTTREHLKKLNVDLLRSYAIDLNLDVLKKKKEDLINIILCSQTPLSALTPVRLTNSLQPHDIVLQENLPPFTTAHYTPVSESVNFPKLSFSAIYDFLISRNREDGKSVQNFKGLDKSVRHYDAGDIQDLSYAQIDEETLYFKAHCLASMKKQRYQVYVCMTIKDNACTVDFAFCQCPIGLAQSCSHIGGLLFAISNSRQFHKQHGNESEESCTSRLCAWKVPRSMNQMAKPLRQMDLSKPKMDKVTPSTDHINTSTDFDPRHSSDRGNDTTWTMSQLVKLKTVFPQTGLAHLWQIPDEAPPALVEEEVQTTVHPLQPLMENMVYSENNFPPPIIDQELVEYIEQQTRGQRNCTMWKDLHKGRITSSLFGNVLKAGSNPSSLVKQILEGSNLDRYAKLPEAVQWGVCKEELARTDYLMIKNAVEECTVQPTGLTLYPTHSFLGASSDGRVFEKDGSGLLEIKCPFSVNGKLVHNMEVADILSMDEASFCMEMSDTGPRLKKLHKYYAQVQGEMAIMGQPWCDFVVWTNAKSNNICIDRVMFDSEFVTSMMPKLVKFYMEHIFHMLYQV